MGLDVEAPRHGLVVGQRREPQAVGAALDRQEGHVADAEDQGLGQPVVADQHLDHREQVLVVVAMDVGVVEAVAGQQVGVRLLPVAGAEHDDLGRGLEPRDVLAAQLAHVEVEVEHRVIAARRQGLGEPGLGGGAVAQRRQQVIGGRQRRQQQRREQRGDQQVARALLPQGAVALGRPALRPDRRWRQGIWAGADKPRSPSLRTGPLLP